MNSPQTLCDGSDFFSKTTTLFPAWARRIASELPAIPAPIIATS